MRFPGKSSLTKNFKMISGVGGGGGNLGVFQLVFQDLCSTGKKLLSEIVENKLPSAEHSCMFKQLQYKCPGRMGGAHTDYKNFTNLS